jgi:hypothetical protein
LSPELKIWIRRAEEKWLPLLKDHGKYLFSETFLPSHDHTHHQRVWNIARALLEQVSTFNKHLDPSLVEGLIIAVWFHDTGMVVTREKEHGRISRELCESFFHEKKLQRPERFGEVLNAIEKHDIKDDRACFGITPDEPPDLLTLLSLADDLEALGVTGVYRYAEIYLLRGMEMRELGVNVLGNAASRFGHFIQCCAMFPQLIRNYRREYRYLVSFYDGYKRQLMIEKDPERARTGYLGVVNAIRRLSVEGKTRPEDFLAEVEKTGPGRMVIGYFTRLKEELERGRLTS